MKDTPLVQARLQISRSHPIARRFVALGVVFALLGSLALANLLSATVAVTLMVGFMMATAGILQLVHAFAVRRWQWCVLWGLGGLLYLAAAIALLVHPLLGALVLTLCLAIGLGMSGTIRILISLATPNRGRGWMLISGIASVAAAAMVGLGWPASALWALGLILAIDLLFQGVMLILIGFGIRSE